MKIQSGSTFTHPPLPQKDRDTAAAKNFEGSFSDLLHGTSAPFPEGFWHNSKKFPLYLPIEKLKGWKENVISFFLFLHFQILWGCLSTVPDEAWAGSPLICLFICAEAAFILWAWAQPPGLKQYNCFSLHHREIHIYSNSYLFIYLVEWIKSNTNLEPAKDFLTE